MKLRECVWKNVFSCLYFTILWNGKMVFAKLKNFFTKLIFSRQNFFCSEKRFPFSKIPQKKKFGGKKINLAKKFFNSAKKVGPYEIGRVCMCVKTGFCVFSYFYFTLLWNCESVCVRKRFCVFAYLYFTILWNCESVCVIKSLK